MRPCICGMSCISSDGEHRVNPVIGRCLDCGEAVGNDCRSLGCDPACPSCEGENDG